MITNLHAGLGGKFIWKLAPHSRDSYDEHDFFAPKEKDYSYENPINAICSTDGENYFNFEFKDGKKTDISFKNCSVVRKTFDPSKVKKVQMGYYSNFVVRAIVLKDKDGNTLY